MLFWFTISSIAYIAMIQMIFTTLKKNADKKSATVSQLFMRLSILIVTIWSLYPLVWLLSIEGYGIITLNSQVGIFAVLDLFAKGAFGYLILQDEEALEQTAPATQ